MVKPRISFATVSIGLDIQNGRRQSLLKYPHVYMCTLTIRSMRAKKVLIIIINNSPSYNNNNKLLIISITKIITAAMTIA